MEASTLSNYQIAEFWIKVITLVGAVVALFLTWRTHAERARFEMIDRVYSVCQTLEAHALRDGFLAHLFCIGIEEYQRVKARIRERFTDTAAYPEYLVKENYSLSRFS
jgi:hypothetical protein